MTLYKNKYRVESARLSGYDYSAPGAYFITICTHGRRHWFGEVRNGRVVLSDSGRIAEAKWRAIPEHFSRVTIDEFVIMPNHIHGIIVIEEANAYPTVETPYTGVSQNFARKSKETPKLGVSTDRAGANISVMINQFKRACTVAIRRAGARDFAWQARFYDHIIRDEQSLKDTRTYIQQNPANWAQDEFFGDADI